MDTQQQAGNLSGALSGDKPKAETVARQLDAAADLLERGWCQHVYEDGDRFCVAGALWHAVGYDAEQREPLMDFVYAALPGDTSIASWNDAPERTQAEAVAVVRKAAELARAA